ncbi:MAG: 8-amino-7-oxononanoate synthase [Candidatus Dadabacteria bacterium]|nr:8-amino-7-oxononanoate synthase [Candidatus Dadabacteria bacterium]NIQ14974.1 8-amino-7-oxononanoate synthase [Candidatus Dadabacteria bacterium]
MNDSLVWIDDEIKTIHDNNLFRHLTEIQTGQHPEIKINGKTNVLLASNSYLGLSVDPRVINASVEALKKYGTGSGGSRLVSGSSDLHRRLEERIAKFKNTESAILFTTGYLANVGTISAIVGPDDIVFSDELNHASIIDGCRLSDAKIQIYKHLDLDHLEELIAQNLNFKKKLIVTDTIFSMDGDLVDLAKLVKIADKYNCMLMIDEAHATGVLGERGSGASEYFGVEDKVPIVMGTLSKAVGSLGGYIAGSKKLTDFIRNRVRSYIFDTSLPAAAIGASLESIDIIENDKDLREHLWKLIEYFKKEINKIGLEILPSHSPIIPILIGEPEPTLNFASSLRERGIYTPAVRPPSVPEGKCRLRVSLMATHTFEHLDRALSAFKEVKQLVNNPRDLANIL